MPQPLPVLSTSFVGRDEDAAALRSLVRRERLVTITGPGGCGKTRLAIEVARRVGRELPGGAVFVELAGLHDPALVASAVASAAGIRESGAAQASLVDQLPGSMLLVLDNCEHLIQACASLVRVLLDGTAAVHVLATSREPLGSHEEREYLLSPLGLEPARQLFVDRASARRPGSAVLPEEADAIDTICSSLDGLPLALELAAARTSVLSVAEIAGRLTDRFRLLTTSDDTLAARQRTLRSLIDWSYDLLTDPERRLFEQLSVFPAGFDAEAAEFVGHVEAGDVLDVLAALVDRSLVVREDRRGRSRFRMLDSIREYALEKDTDAELAPRFVRFYLARAKSAVSELDGGARDRWLVGLEDDHDNYRHALSIAGAEEKMALASALSQFWYLQGHFGEGLHHLGAALAHPLGGEGRARALVAASKLAFGGGDYEHAKEWAEEALLEGASGEDIRAHALLALGNVAYGTGAYDDARRHYESSAASFRELGDSLRETSALHNLAIVAQEQGDLAAARRFFEQGAAAERERGDLGELAQSLGALGAVALEQGDLEAARRNLRESLDLSRRLGLRRTVLVSLQSMGRLELAGDLDAAQSCIGECLELARELTDRAAIATSVELLGNIAMRRGELDEARARFEESLALHEDLGFRRGIASSLLLLGYVSELRGDRRTARASLSRSVQLCEDLGLKHPLAATLLYAGDVERDEGNFEAAEECYERSASVSEDPVPARTSLALLAAMRGDHARAESQLLQLVHSAVSRVDGSLALEGLASVAESRGSHDQAAALLGAADAFLGRRGANELPRVRPLHESTAARARQALGTDAFEASYERGRRMSNIEAIEAARRGAVEAAAGASLFRREGDFWTVVHGGAVLRVKDSKGLRYVAHLLAHPGKEFHALDLASIVEGAPSPSARVDPELKTASGSADEVIDPRARDAYRQRLADLNSELEEAESWGDLERAAQAREAIDAIVSHLRSGLGLGGRSRRAPSEAERARSAVGKAIRGTIERIGMQSPDAGRVLGEGIRTGTFCSYVGEVSWAVS